MFGDVERFEIKPLYDWSFLVEEVAVRMGDAVPKRLGKNNKMSRLK